MGYALFRSSLAFMIILVSVQVRATQLVHDPSSFARFGEMLSSSNNMLSQLQDVSSELSTLNSVLGDPVQGTITEQMGQANWLASDFGGVLSSLTSPYGDPLSSLNSLGVNHGGMEDQSRYLHIKDYAQSKLFPDASQNPLSFDQHDTIKETRYKALRTSSIESVALSSQQKGALKSSNQEIQKLSKQAKRDRTLQDEIRTTNELLVLIANELSQQRALLAQLLELKASVVAHKMPVVFNTTSLSKKKETSSFHSKSGLFGK